MEFGASAGAVWSLAFKLLAVLLLLREVAVCMEDLLQVFIPM